MTRTWSTRRAMRVTMSATCAGEACGRSGRVPEGDLDAAGRVERDAAIFDRLPQHHGQHHDDVGGRAWGQLGLQVDDEGLDVLAADRGQREVTEAGQDVLAQVAAVCRPGAGPA